MNSFERFSYNLVGMRILEKRDHYVQLRNDLISSRMKKSFVVYVANAILFSLTFGLLAAVIIGTISWLLRLPQIILAKTGLIGPLASVSGVMSGIGMVFFVLLSFAIVAGITYVTFMLYPGIVAGSRCQNIDANLPYAINYLSSMSAAGIVPVEIFRLLGDSPIYGECAVEARYIAREVDVFGKDLIAAIRTVSVTTPSERMKEFLQGATASISSGGDLTEYFRTKSAQYALENQQTQKQFLDTLALIAESYVTVMVAGVLFLVILQSIMSVMSGDNKPIFLYIIIYLMIPIGTILFIIIISTLTPET